MMTASDPPAATNSGTEQYRIPDLTYGQFVVAIGGGEGQSSVLLDARSGALTPLTSPSPKAQLSAYDPLTRTGIFFASDSTGLQIWRQSLPNGSPQVLATANTFQRTIAIMMRMMMNGKITTFFEDKGFGFITPSNGGKDLFVHVTGLIDQVREGDEVTFDVEEGKKGPGAVNVKLV